MNHNPDLRFGQTIHLVPICIRHEHGFYGGPSGYQVIPRKEAWERSSIILKQGHPYHVRPRVHSNP